MWTVHNPAADAILFGQVRLEWDLVLASGALLCVVALGVWAIVKVKKWREEPAEEVGPTHQQLLEHYKKMVAEGLLDPDELARIKAQLDQNQPPASDQPPDTSIREI
jgi:hypothetical protein